MVTTGFSLPYVAKYSNSGATVTYTGGMPLGRGVSLSIEVEGADDNNFFADNVLAETENAVFTSGTATITIDGLENSAATLIFGLPAPDTITPTGGESAEMQGYGDDMNPPYVGFGCVWMSQMNGVTTWRPVVLTKIKFGLPSQEMNTKEDQIDWQTQELEATILRDDTTKHRWKYVAAEGMASEEAAFAVVKKMLGGN